MVFKRALFLFVRLSVKDCAMPYLLVFTFYSGDDIVGVDVKPFPRFIHPIEVMTMEITAPSVSDLAVVSCSRFDNDDLFWIEAFSMVNSDGENN